MKNKLITLACSILLSAGAFAQDIEIDHFEGVTAPGGDFNFFGGGSQFGGTFDFSAVFSFDVPSESTGEQSFQVTWQSTEAGGSFFNMATLPEVTGWHGTAPLDLSSISYISLWIKGTTDGEVAIDFYSGAQPGSEVSESPYFPVTSEWSQVTIPVADWANPEWSAGGPVDWTDVQAAQVRVINHTILGLNDIWIDDIVGTNDPGSGGGDDKWAGYDITNEVGDVDTGDFIGWINVAAGDWVWTYSLDHYIYLPEANVGDTGAWSYVPK